MGGGRIRLQADRLTELRMAPAKSSMRMRDKPSRLCVSKSSVPLAHATPTGCYGTFVHFRCFGVAAHLVHHHPNQ